MQLIDCPCTEPTWVWNGDRSDCPDCGRSFEYDEMGTPTVPFSGDAEVAHEAMLLKCWRNRDFAILAAHCSGDEPEDKPITDTRPTRVE